MQCKECGSDFRPTNKRGRPSAYCSQYCRNKNYNKNHKEEKKEYQAKRYERENPKVELVCEICQKPFLNKRNTKYCSGLCKTRAYWMSDAGRKRKAVLNSRARKHYPQTRKDGGRFDLSGPEVLALLEKQEGKCAICKEKPEPDRLGRALCLDHDHNTGKARAFLCVRCNAGLGQFLDRPNLLEEAALYLKRHAG